MLRRAEEKAGTPPWFTTFADMNMLLMVFFIMLFSLLSADKSRYSALRERLEAAAGPSLAGIEPATGLSVEGARSAGTLLDRFEAQTKALAEFVRPRGHEALLQKTTEGTLLTLGGSVEAFPEGAWSLSPAQKEALAEIKRWLAGRRHVIEVRGHASANLQDSVVLGPDGRVRAFGPEDLARPDRMEAANHSLLSWLRADAVRRFLVEEHPDLDDRVRLPELQVRVRADGYTRALADSAAPEQRPRNRRIEILATREIVER
jgi:flagellar motor protein MotB